MSILFSDPFSDKNIEQTLLEMEKATAEIMSQFIKDERTLCPFSYIHKWWEWGDGFKGRKHTEQSKAKMRESAKGNTNGSFTKGRKHTDETKQKMSESAKKSWEDPEKKKKLSKYRSSVMGEQNKGRKWFNDGVRNYFRYPHEQQSDWVVGLIHFGSNQ